MDAIFGERFYGTRKPAWHGIGQIFDKALKPSVAVKKVGMDYTVQTYPMYSYPVKGKKVESARLSILRSPTTDDPEWREFGTASGIYEVIQNADLAEMLDPLAEYWPLETMGALQEGKTFFATLNTGGAEIEGDPINGYFMLVDVKDGGTATKLVYTPVRVVCQNTLTSGLQQASISMSIQHITGARQQVEARVNLIAKAQHAIEETHEAFRQLAQTKVKTDDLIDSFFAKVYPLPKPPADMALVDYPQEDLGDVLFQKVKDSMYNYNYYTEQAQNNQANSIMLYEKLNDEFPSLAGSLWHAYNSVVEYADYRMGGQNPEVSTLFGSRMREKTRAFKTAMSLVK